ncbi:MAG: DUF177 domain-containing protein [Candidatus Sericytochromatia bacterium]
MRDQTFVWEVDLPPGSFQDEDMDVLDIRGTLTLCKQLNVIKCVGDLQVKARLISGRTLEPFEVEFPVSFVEGLEVVQKYHFPEVLEFGMEDSVDQIRPDEPIDLNELIRQHIILNLPIQNPESEPEVCYNDDSSLSEADSEPETDPAWDAVRKTVESWEKPSAN